MLEPPHGFEPALRPVSRRACPRSPRFLSKFSFDSLVADLTTPEGLAQARDLESLGGGILAASVLDDVDTRTYTGPAGNQLEMRVFAPDGRARALYLDIHGGGFCMGHPKMGDVRNRAMARDHQIAVVSAQYRLGPEHPWPAGPDDCETAALWVLGPGRDEFGSVPLLIGGGSAGANLAALTLVKLRDRHDAAAEFIGANLVFGVYDLSGTPSQIKLGTLGFRSLYVGDRDTNSLQNPDISPLYADLRGLCPALFTVGTLDYLYDDSLFMAARWRADGNPAELAIYPASPHGFTMFPTKMTQVANHRTDAWLAKILGGTDG